MIVAQNSTFSRTAANYQKMGAYCTDLEHMKDLHQLFTWPDNEVCVLEPCCNTGEAVFALTGAKDNSNIKLFGIELNEEVYKIARENGRFEEVLCADFLTEARINHNKFSFVFCNPPYITDDLDEGERTERSFLERIVPLMKKDGILVWVVPHRIFSESTHLSYWMSRFDTLACYRFREEEYDKWKQVVVIGRRKAINACVLKQDREQFQTTIIPVSILEELPSSFEQKIEIKPSLVSEINLFTKKEFDVTSALTLLDSQIMPDVQALLNKRLSVPEYVVNNLGNPPIKMKKDSLYLCATAGGGQGITGTDGVDLHLQRGRAEVVEETTIELDEASGSEIEKVTTHTRITMCIIENSGKITSLV